jgi:thiamine phosphate synthase YjbQ (UPF0047 family)
MSFQNQISLNTKGHGDMKDITEQVAAVVNSSGIKTGIANVFNIGSTAAVGTIEFEPGLQGDMPAILDKLIPPSRNYGHEQTWHDGNRPFPPASNIARTVTDRADRGWEAGSRHLATDLPSRMRCSRAPTHGPGDGGWRLRTLTRKLE